VRKTDRECGALLGGSLRELRRSEPSARHDDCGERKRRQQPRQRRLHRAPVRHRLHLPSALAVAVRKASHEQEGEQKKKIAVVDFAV